jgi:hypothetical protein
MAIEEPSMAEALSIQALACEALGSPMYAELLDGLRCDFDEGGVVSAMLKDRPRPVRDAVPLRLLGGLHRLVLAGEEPDLATHYPSAGGRPGNSLVTDVLSAITRRRDDIDAALDRQVQTNEVGRSAVLASGFSEIGQRTGLPLSLKEIGGSAGLNLQWDRYFYDTGATSIGSPTSAVQFGPDTWTVAPNLAQVDVIDRAACDIAPLDALDPDSRLRLLSFVWPDMDRRFVRLGAALDIAAASEPITIAQASADDWLAAQLRAPTPGAATVVFHSIVWQYLPPATQGRVKDLLEGHGSAAASDQPLLWLRMEPAGPVAALRLTSWPGGIDEQLATSSYHGADIDWH